MSRIYEALQQAQREKGGAGDTPPFRPSSRPEPGSAVFRGGHALQKAMIGLYQSIDSLLPDLPEKVIQFIGSRAGEGASTVAREFGIICARVLGKSVLILDADQLNPAQHVFFRIAPENGLEDLIDGDAEKAIYRVDGSNLCVCTVSPGAAVTRHFLDAAKIDNLLKRLKGRFDLILVDSPPATSSPDGIAISRNVDGVVLVLEAEATRWPVAESAKESIEKNGGKIIGVVFNKRRYHIPDFIYKRL